MPFRSQAQQRFAFGTGQPWAKRWAKETNFAKLPKRIRKKIKDAGTVAGAPLAGPGGLLGTPGMGRKRKTDDYPDQTQFAGYTMEDWDDTKPDSFYHDTRPRKWGNRTKDKCCSCGVATKESLGPGITRIRGNLCNVHGRYGRCPGSSAAPKGKKPKQPRATPEQRAEDTAALRRDKRDQVLSDMGIDPGASEALVMLRNGEQPDPAALARAGAVDAGLVEQAEDGSYRMTPSGRALIAAAEAGDPGRAGDVISAARDRKTARTAREQAAAQKKVDAANKRAEAAAAKKQPAKGSGGKGGATPGVDREQERQATRQQREEERQADRKKREEERQAGRATREAERQADRAQRQRERSEDRAAMLEERRARRRGPAVPQSRTPIVMPRRKRQPNATRSKSFAVFKSADGSYRWLARTTTAYRDRDGEIITTKALEQDAVRMTATGIYGPLRYWHIGQPDPFDPSAPWGIGLDIGACDYSTVIGRTSIESGTFKSAAIGKAFAESAGDYELSPGFFHPPSQPNAAGEYADIRRFERSVVPVKYGRASNLFTGMTVKEARMDQGTYEQRVKAFLADMNAKGVPAEVAAQSLSSMQQADKSAEQQGIAFKSEEQPADVAPVDPIAAALAALGVALKGIAQPAREVNLTYNVAGSPPAALKADGDMPPEEMIEAGETEEADGEMEEVAEETSGEYIGDMTPAEFWAQLQQMLAPVLKMQEMVKTMTDMGGELKSLYATKDAGATARIDALEQQLRTLAGDMPAVTQPADVAAALKGAPQAPADPSAPQLPADATALQQIAARTMPALYSANPNGQWNGWVPPTPLPQS